MPWDAGNAPNGFTTGTPWLPVKYAQSALNVAGQNADPDSTLAFYRAILAWRKPRPVLRLGDLVFVKTAEPVLAFRRTMGDESLLCIFNLSAEAQDLVVAGIPERTELEPVSQHAVLAGKSLQLGANGYAFIAVPAGKRVSLRS